MSNQPEVIKEIEKILAPDRRIDTALSVVFLAGPLAYKLKRELKNNFVDYSSLEKRREFCLKELRLNKRNAPGIYNTVVAVGRESGGPLTLGRGGSPVEYLLEMNRFEDSLLFNKLAEKGALTEELACSLADKIAELHGSARAAGAADYSEKFSNAVKISIRQLRESSDGVLPSDLPASAEKKLLSAYNGCRDVLKKRSGFVRECHGDLHLGNICLFEGSPCVFDAVEFNDDFTHIDPFFDLAFLLMDLSHHGLPGRAAVVADKYIAGTRSDPNDFAALMPLYLGLRAIIRCSISAASAKEALSEARASELKFEASKYYREALSFLQK
jgi:hypothetical protein